MPSTSFLLRVDLQGANPKIWRRFFVPPSITLPELHRVVQTVMGWHGPRNWHFVIRRKCYPDTELMSEDSDMAKVALCSLVGRRGMIFQYICQFEDTWKHRLTLSNDHFDSSKQEVDTMCVAGEGACPPRDVGGIEGYVEFLRAFEDPEHPDHYDVLDEFGEDFDRDEFYLDRINASLRALN